MKTIILLMAFGFIFYSANLFAQTATDLNCTSCVQTSEIQDNAIKSGKINNAAVTSIKILDGTILNADISSMAAIDASKISGTAWTSTNDGSGSSLEADLLDGLDGAQFLRSDISGTIAGDLTATGNLSGTGICIGADCRSVWPAEGEESAWTEGEGSTSYTGNVEIGGTVSLLSDALTIDNSWNPDPSYEGTTYTTRATLQTTTGSNNSIAIHTGSGERTALVTDGPFISTESGAYFYGDVGIGTSEPSVKLEVNGSVKVNGWDAVLESVDSSGRKHHLIGNYEGWDEEAIYLAGYNATNSADQSTKRIYFGSESVMVDIENARVGLGTTSPSYKLDINSGTGTVMRIAGGGDLQIDAEVSGDNSVFYNDYGTLNLNTGLNIHGSSQMKELIVTETIAAGDLRLNMEGFADFVFKDDYPLKSLSEVESFIQQNKHLPDIPSENEVLENGVSVGEMQKRLLQKVEELTLYVIAQDKKIEGQDKKITQQDKIIAELERGGK